MIDPTESNNRQADKDKLKSPPPAPPDHGAVQIAVVDGIPIRLHFSFLLLAAFLLIGFWGPSIASAVFVLVLFACVLLHELGHSVVAQHYGIRVESITLYPIGGLARITSRPTPAQELRIALAGPAVNVLIAGILYAALVTSHQWVPDSKLAHAAGNWPEKMAIANLFLAAFNMIPAFPMDGGRVLRAILALSGMTLVKATANAALIGRMLAVAGGLYGALHGNLMLMVIAVFIYLGAGEEAAVVRQESVFTGVPVSTVMVTDIHTLRPGDTLQNAADLLLMSSQHDFPVVNGEEVVGLVTREAMLRGLATEGPTGYVAGSMNREFPRAKPDDEMATLFRGPNTAAPNITLPLVIINSADKLVGMVTSENITEYFAIQQMLAIGRRHIELGIRR